jgi:CYTH domain-containing protein
MLQIDKNFGKYAKAEVERKFLLKALPEGAVLHSEITDLYITDTTLRLRKAKTETGIAYKLGQKIRPNPESARVILHTNMYLTESEFALLSALPGKQLTKKRYALVVDGTPVWVDQFEGELEGLIIAEIDFGEVGDPEAFSKPSFFMDEVTDDERFTGASLADQGFQ